MAAILLKAEIRIIKKIIRKFKDGTPICHLFKKFMLNLFVYIIIILKNIIKFLIGINLTLVIME